MHGCELCVLHGCALCVPCGRTSVYVELKYVAQEGFHKYKWKEFFKYTTLEYGWVHPLQEQVTVFVHRGCKGQAVLVASWG
jgi:hypothetical protein